MTEQELGNLIGLSVADAEKQVASFGCVTRVYTVDSPRIALTLPDNVVELIHENNKVISAECQAVIDRKYFKKCHPKS